jgi:hypothetical protein
MKITVGQLRQVIQEEVNEVSIYDRFEPVEWGSRVSQIRADLDRPVGEPGEGQGGWDPQLLRRLHRAAANVGGDTEFVSEILVGITNALSSEGMGGNHALKTITNAFETIG